MSKYERYEMVRRNLAKNQHDTLARIDDYVKGMGKKEKRLEKFRKEQRLDNDITKDKRAERHNRALN